MMISTFSQYEICICSKIIVLQMAAKQAERGMKGARLEEAMLKPK